MKAIVEYTGEEYEEMLLKWGEIREAVKGLRLADMFEGLTIRRSYRCYTFSGRCKEALYNRLGRWPNAEEVIMLVDGGFNNFGAACAVRDDGRFVGRVNTD